MGQVWYIYLLPFYPIKITHPRIRYIYQTRPMDPQKIGYEAGTKKAPFGKKTGIPNLLGKFIIFHQPTLPETNSSHLKMDGWKTNFLSG